MRPVGIGLAALVATFLIVSPVGASSATSWRATIVGTTLHGGATTLIQSNGTGSISVKLYGVTPGESADILVNPSPCPDEAQDVFGFDLPPAGADGVASGRHTLTAQETHAYNEALSRRTKLSLLVVTSDDKGCGNQVGAPSVGTGRVEDSKTENGSDIYSYDLRYPVVSGIDPAAASLINATLKGQVDALVAEILKNANEAEPDTGPVALDEQTFTVRLSQSGLLSIRETLIDNSAPDTDHFPSAFTFDTATGGQVALSDVVRADAAGMALLQAEVARILAPKGRLYVSQSFLRDDTPWNLVPAGLEFTFSDLQPIGIQPYQVVVPWSRLRPIVKLNSPVAVLAGPGPCEASQLASTITDWEGGVGSRFTTVHLVNQSPVSCFLQGTPQSQLIDATGRVLLDSARAGADGLPHVSPGDPKITVAPGGKAHIDVQTNNYCGPAPVGFVRVALRLPGGTARVISWHAPTISAGDVPPCNGFTAPGVITTNGWHHG
jgi:hypothetical protein